MAARAGRVMHKEYLHIKRTFTLMKKLLLLLFVSVFVFGGCKNEGIGINFKMDYTSSFTIEAGGGINLPIEIFTPEVTTDSEAEFEANDTRKDKIQEIKLESLSLTITSPEGQNFDFMKNIYLYINAEGLEEQRYAFIENIPEGYASINLNADGVDLAEYIKKDKFSLRVKAVQDKTMTRDIDVSAAMVFAVRANPLK
jgi:hypothetical protein